jgi:hypothetical protein
MYEKSAIGSVFDPPPIPAHVVTFYSSQLFPARSIADFIGSSLHEGGSGVVLAKQSHREAILECLCACGFDPGALQKRGRLFCHEPKNALVDFRRNGRLERRLTVAALKKIVAASLLKSNTGRAAIFGEIVSVLVEEGEAQSALQLERWWNEIVAAFPIHLHCGYDATLFTKDDSLVEEFCSLCNEHGGVILEPTLPSLADKIPTWWVTLQKQAILLRNEVARREHAELKLKRNEVDRLKQLEAIVREGYPREIDEQYLGWIEKKIYEVCAGAFRERTECVPGSVQWHKLTGEILGYDKLIRALGGRHDTH